MPTGYTMNVEKGQSFSSFVWGCAKAFGACVTMRDDNSDTPVPEEFKPSDYHSKKADEIGKEIRLLDKRSDASIEKEIKQETSKVERMNAEYREEDELKKKRFADMMRQVEKWEPPSKDHEELKKFMKEQLGLETKYADSKPYQHPLPEQDVEIYRLIARKKLVKDFEQHQAEYAKEVSRVAVRNAWIIGLRASVPQPSKGE